MPIYAYKCDSCGLAKDILRKISDPLLSVCPACGAATFTKQLTAAGFQLKGSGWYATDFKGGAAPPASGEGAKDPGTESKPAEKPAESGAVKADTSTAVSTATATSTSPATPSAS